MSFSYFTAGARMKERSRAAVRAAILRAKHELYQAKVAVETAIGIPPIKDANGIQLVRTLPCGARIYAQTFDGRPAPMEPAFTCRDNRGEFNVPEQFAVVCRNYDRCPVTCPWLKPVWEVGKTFWHKYSSDVQRFAETVAKKDLINNDRHKTSVDDLHIDQRDALGGLHKGVDSQTHPVLVDHIPGVHNAKDCTHSGDSQSDSLKCGHAPAYTPAAVPAATLNPKP